jgi:gamma-glutamyltranspeptidase / glutathione hydrolase
MRNFSLPGRSPVIAANGMAATSHPLATMTAIDVLKRGGNAVDAALAASATLAVVEPHMTGIGGDCFAIIGEPDGTLHGLNGSGRAGMGVDAERYRAHYGNTGKLAGGASVTVPGSVKAWETLHQRFGSLDWASLYSDAIRYAEDGYAIHARVAATWAQVEAELQGDEGARLHALVDSAAPVVGARHRWPALGQTLRRIATDGSRAIYEGEIAAEIAATVQAKGGALTEADLAAVSADWVDPIAVNYGGLDLHELPPNGQGITALVIARLLDRLGARGLPADSAERRHLEAEAGRIGYALRDHLIADPASMTRTVGDILADRSIEALAALFDPARRNAELVLPNIPSASTIYLTVVDRDRRSVSFINSLYEAFGSKIFTPKSGIVLQNRAAGFSLVGGHPNEIAPGKRPMHTIIPAMTTKGGMVDMSFGVMGGAYQAMGHAHVLSNIVDYGMDVQEALDSPRIFWAADGALEAESGISDDIVAGLEHRGHVVRRSATPIGAGQIVRIDWENGFLVGASDPRKDGFAAGW